VIRTVLFDIGNVLAPDYWECLWLTRGLGLADRLGLQAAVIKDVGTDLWGRYSKTLRDEDDYWNEFSSAIGKALPTQLIREVEATVIKPNPYAKQAFNQAIDLGLRIGTISNNTSFWYSKQLALLDFHKYADPALNFLSCNAGVETGQGAPDLFGIAAQTVDTKETMIFDDRPSNVAFAVALGFQAKLYGHQDEVDVKADAYYQPNHYVPFIFDAI